jgi:two-component system invasion response regulator UvrY
MKILITDDHAVVRHGLKQLLAEEFKRAVFGEAASAMEALDCVWKENWDVVVLDLSMPGHGGLEALKEIKKFRPKLPVIVLSMHPEDQFALRLIRAGAAGYLTKETAPKALVAAIRKVVAGGRYVSEALAEKMVASLGTDVDVAPHERLSDREFLVFRLIAAGKPASAIARELSLSVKTISTYGARAREKMGMSTNAEMTHYAIQHNLVENSLAIWTHHED